MDNNPVEIAAQPSSAGVAPGETPAHDPVNRPSHYVGKTMQVIDVIEAWRANAHMGNVLKYIMRAPNKNGIQDLQKAIWYLNRAITTHTGPLQTEKARGPNFEVIRKEFGISMEIAGAYTAATIAMQLGGNFLNRRTWLQVAIDNIEAEIVRLQTGSGGAG
jgi:hypothetical protein